VTAIDRDNRALDAGRRSKGPGCLSNLALDRYLLDELSPPERQGVAGHLVGCRTCADLYAVMQAERVRFADQPLASLAADALARAGSSRPSWLRRLLIPATALCAGAAALAVLWTPRADFRSKGSGGFSLSPYVLHPERAVTGGDLRPGEALHPGDKLQFRYHGRDGYLAVVAVDAGGTVSVFYPPGAQAAPVTGGRDVALSSAVELDGSLGRELVVAVRCDQPVAVAEVVRAAQHAADAARARGASPTELAGLGLPCDETRQTIAKSKRSD
jgi:hypothetical protein